MCVLEREHRANAHTQRQKSDRTKYLATKHAFFLFLFAKFYYCCLHLVFGCTNLFRRIGRLDLFHSAIRICIRCISACYCANTYFEFMYSDLIRACGRFSLRHIHCLLSEMPSHTTPKSSIFSLIVFALAVFPTKQLHGVPVTYVLTWFIQSTPNTLSLCEWKCMYTCSLWCLSYNVVRSKTNGKWLSATKRNIARSTCFMSLRFFVVRCLFTSFVFYESIVM